MRRLIPLVLFLAACAPDSQNIESEAVLLDNARIIVGDGQAIERGAVLIRDGRIADVREAPEGDVPGVRRVDLDGATVLPALIDAHVHLGYEGFTGWGGEFYSRDRVEEHLARLAWYGFGAALTTGTDNEQLMSALVAEQERGPVRRARVLFAPGVAPPQAGPNPQMLKATRKLPGEVVHGIGSRGEVEALVARLDSLPTHLIKIWVDDRGGAQPKLAAEVYRPLIAAARRRNMEVIAHQQSVADMLQLLDAGAAGFLHGRFGPDFGAQEAAALKAADAWIVPNLGLGERGRSRDYADPFLTATLPEATVRRLERGFRERPAATTEEEQALSGTMRALVDAEADVILGTDAGALADHFFGYAGHRELWRFVELGMTPMQALRAATSVAARQLGLEDSGTVAAGMRADLLVLDADPLEDIRNTQRIRQVYLDGRPIDRDSLAAIFRGEDPC